MDQREHVFKPSFSWWAASVISLHWGFQQKDWGNWISSLDQNNGLLGSNMHVENPRRWCWVGLRWWQDNRKVAGVKLEGELMKSVTLKVGVRKGRTPGRLQLPTKIVKKRICRWKLWELPWVCWVQLILRHPCEDTRRPCEYRIRMLRLQLVMSLISNALWSSIGGGLTPRRTPPMHHGYLSFWPCHQADSASDPRKTLLLWPTRGPMRLVGGRGFPGPSGVHESVPKPL